MLAIVGDDVRYREFIGIRLLAIVSIVPAFLFLGLALEGSAWWLLAALAYPVFAIAVLGYLNRDQP